MGFTLFYLSLLVLIPLAGLVLQTATMGWSRFVEHGHAAGDPGLLSLEPGGFAGRGAGECRLRLPRGLGAGALYVSGQEADRCHRRSAVRPAHGGVGDRAERALCPRRLDRPLASPRRGDFLLVLGRGDRADFHRPAFRGADLAAGAGRPRPADRRGGRQPRRGPLADLLPRDPAVGPAGPVDRLFAGLRPGAGRIRFGGVHRQHVGRAMRRSCRCTSFPSWSSTITPGPRPWA